MDGWLRTAAAVEPRYNNLLNASLEIQVPRPHYHKLLLRCDDIFFISLFSSPLLGHWFEWNFFSIRCQIREVIKNKLARKSWVFFHFRNYRHLASVSFCEKFLFLLFRARWDFTCFVNFKTFPLFHSLIGKLSTLLWLFQWEPVYNFINLKC
jgi:hypothetical protein